MVAVDATTVRCCQLPTDIGVAPALQDRNPFRVMRNYITRMATDIPFHQQIEQNPVLAKALNLPDNGRGEAIPEHVMDSSGREVAPGMLLGKPSVKAMFREYAGHVTDEAREFSKLHSIAAIPLLGGLSRARHGLIAANTAFREILNPSEQHLYGEAMKNMLDNFSGAREQAIASGSMRPGRNVNRFAAMDQLDGVLGAVDKFNKFTGAEGVSQAGMTFSDQLGRLLTAKRIDAGDSAFLSKWGPADWAAKLSTPEGKQAVIDYAAANLTRNTWGNYTGRDLPAWLAQGTADPWAAFFSLSRAPIGRFNNWYKNAYQPALNGNPVPLLHSLLGSMATAGLVNYLREKITERKPSELTWPEYLKLGGADTAHTLFAKAATGGYAGILSELALYGNQFAHGEPIQGFNSPVFITESSIFERAAQFANAWRKDETGIEGLATVANAMLKDNIQLYRQLGQAPDRGQRDEALAQRLGYMVEPPLEVERNRPNPLSATQLELSGNVGGLRQLMAAKMKTGHHITMPQPEYEGRLTPTMRQGQPENYYSFIRAARGEAAANEAMTRDQANTMKKYQTMSSALSGR